MAKSKDGRGKHPNSRKNLKLFKEGQSGNPKGRPKNILTRLNEAIGDDPDEKIGATLTLNDYKDVALWLMERTQGELVKLVKDPKTPAFILIMVRALQKDASKGSMWAFDNLFDRFLDEQPEAAGVVFVTGFDLGENELEEDPETDDDEESDKDE